MSAAVLLLLLAAVLLTTAAAQNSTCPLDFTVLSRLYDGTNPPQVDPSQNCQYIRQGLRLVQSDYLLRTNNFLPPLSTADSCWRSYQRLVNDVLPNFDIRSSCGFQTSWISQGCMNITTRQQFETLVTNSSLSDVVSSCDQSLENNSPCAACTASLSRIQALHLTGNSVGNVSDCQAYPSIYAAAVVNPLGPNDRGTAKCLFLLDFGKPVKNKKKLKKFVIVGVCVGVILALLIVIGGLWFWRRKYGMMMMKKKRRKLNRLGIDNKNERSTSLENITESTTLVKFKFDEIKKATRSFSRDQIIGKGGYGNVYKGRLMDGSEVAVKRFKNCSAAGDASFAHEVEVIASVRHVNLVALRGYCIATTSMEGHQRIIVCELMKNGSLHDHLLAGNESRKLSWPVRQKIALGTAKGLAYLHYGAQPGIIHRDIKASNILLDDNFEAKVADFGLAKFNPEGMTHLSTRVAGTMGYVAPEYALYGQLTERSDVYSYGVVLLELLSGKKALFKLDDEDSATQPCLLTDWAWSLVKEGRGLDVVEDGMPELAAPDVLERYVLVAVLCSHPQLYARPTMDQVVKMLETELVVPSIPQRSIPLVSEMDDIERSVSSTSGSGQLFSPSGYHSFGFGPSGTKEEEDAAAPESRT